MGLVAATVRRPASTGGFSSAYLIDEGYRWASRHDLYLYLDRDLALEIGYTVHMLGESVDLLADVLDKLGVAHTVETGTTGRRYVVRAPVVELVATAEEESDEQMVALKGTRRAKLDVRLSSNERESLELAARARGVTASALLRELGLHALNVTDPVETPKRRVVAHRAGPRRRGGHGRFVPELRTLAAIGQKARENNAQPA